LFDPNKDKEKEKEEDRLILGYDTIVRENAYLPPLEEYSLAFY
jgi:hypothetical protein